jgi:DNA-binding NarL/FixJ family response regulator
MLREIIKELLAAQPDMDVVGECLDIGSLRQGLDGTRAALLIIGNDKPEITAACRDLLLERPHLKVLAVGADGRETFLFETRPQELALGEISPERLVRAVRAAMGTSEL